MRFGPSLRRRYSLPFFLRLRLNLPLTLTRLKPFLHFFLVGGFGFAGGGGVGGR